VNVFQLQGAAGPPDQGLYPQTSIIGSHKALAKSP